MCSMLFYVVAVVLSVSVPEALHTKWKESDLNISPSALFQSALETELDKTNRHLVYWSSRALNAEKKLKMISNLIEARDKDVKKFLLFESDSWHKDQEFRINTIWVNAMPETETIQRYFPLLKSNAEKLMLASTLDALRERGYVPSSTTQAAFISLCFSRGLNDYLKELAVDE